MSDWLLIACGFLALAAFLNLCERIWNRIETKYFSQQGRRVN